MPFGQKMGSYLRTGFGNVKQFLGSTYAHTKKTLGTMDSVFGDVKKIYGALQPALQDLAPQQLQGGLGKLDSAVMKGVQGYEGIRNKIDDAEQTMVNKVGDVMSKVGGVQKTLKDQGVNLGGGFFTGPFSTKGPRVTAHRPKKASTQSGTPKPMPRSLTYTPGRHHPQRVSAAGQCGPNLTSSPYRQPMVAAVPLASGRHSSAMAEP